MEWFDFSNDISYGIWGQLPVCFCDEPPAIQVDLKSLTFVLSHILGSSLHRREGLWIRINNPPAIKSVWKLLKATTSKPWAIATKTSKRNCQPIPKPLKPLQKAKATTSPRNDLHLQVHVPYRDSMMTSVLRDSLGGNCFSSTDPLNVPLWGRVLMRLPRVLRLLPCDVGRLNKYQLFLFCNMI